MTQAEKKLLQDTHDGIVELKTKFETIIIGNGVKGLACQVTDNRKAITKQKEKFDKVYYKLIGGGVVIIAIAEVIAKVVFR